jgi:hypothetical protein
MAISDTRLAKVVEIQRIGLWSECMTGFAIATGPIPLDVLQMASS